MAVLVTLDELKARLPWTLDADEELDATDALEYLSELACSIGQPWPTPESCPRLVRNVIITATKRYLRNPDGYVQSRAGDETLQWTDLGPESGSPHFTKGERRVNAGQGGKGGVQSAPASAWGPQRTDATADLGYVPVTGGGKPFPLYNDPVNPW